MLGKKFWLLLFVMVSPFIHAAQPPQEWLPFMDAYRLVVQHAPARALEFKKEALRIPELAVKSSIAKIKLDLMGSGGVIEVVPDWWLQQGNKISFMQAYQQAVQQLLVSVPQLSSQQLHERPKVLDDLKYSLLLIHREYVNRFLRPARPVAPPAGPARPAQLVMEGGMPVPSWLALQPDQPALNWWWRGGTMIRDRFVEDIIGMSEEAFKKAFSWSQTNPFDPAKVKTRSEKPWVQDYQGDAGQYRRAAIFQGAFERLSLQNLNEKITRGFRGRGDGTFSILIYD